MLIRLLTADVLITGPLILGAAIAVIGVPVVLARKAVSRRKAAVVPHLTEVVRDPAFRQARDAEDGGEGTAA